MKKLLDSLLSKHLNGVLIIGITLLTLTTAIAVCLTGFWLARLVMEKRLVSSTSRHLAELVTQLHLPPTRRLAEHLAQVSGGHIVFTTNGTILVSTLKLPDDLSLKDGETISLNQSTFHVAAELVHADNQTICLWLLLPQEKIITMLASSRWLILLLLFVAGTLTLLVVLLLLRVTMHLQNRLQEANRRLAKAETTAMAGKLSSSVVHELRNPLSGIKMNAQILMADVPEHSDIAEMAHIIVREANRIDEFLHTLTDLPDNDVARQLTTMPLRQLLDEIAELFLTKCRQAEVTLSMQLNDTIDDDVSTQWPALQLRQVLINLITNAIEASPKGGTITVTVRQEDSLTLRVSDEGNGIHPRDDEDIFAPFVSHKETGCGLGLHICRKITTANHGTLTWQNNPQKGVTFTLEL